MKVFWIYLLTINLYQHANSLIIPDEVPSILSLIYSNIPTLKKGTDSRLGWGFRLGDRADFQVLVELGPQTNTQPLANQGENANNKRETINSYINELYAKRQHEKKIISDTEGGKFLDQWSQSMMTTRAPFINTVQQLQQTLLSSARPPGIKLGVGEIDAKSVIPPDSIIRLQEMYLKQQPVSAEASSGSTSTTVRTKTTTDATDALDNVSLD